MQVQRFSSSRLGDADDWFDRFNRMDLLLSGRSDRPCRDPRGRAESRAPRLCLEPNRTLRRLLVMQRMTRIAVAVAAGAFLVGCGTDSSGVSPMTSAQPSASTASPATTGVDADATRWEFDCPEGQQALTSMFDRPQPPDGVSFDDLLNRISRDPAERVVVVERTASSAVVVRATRGDAPTLRAGLNIWPNGSWSVEWETTCRR